MAKTDLGSHPGGRTWCVGPLAALLLCLLLAYSQSAGAAQPAAATARRLAQPAPSPMPAQTAVPGPAAPPTVTALFLGVPAGDAYGPTSLALNSTRGLAYVFSEQSAPRPTADSAMQMERRGGPVLSVVDLARAQVQRVIPVPAGPGNGAASTGGEVLLAPDGSQGYVINEDLETLTLFDPLSGRAGAHLHGVRHAALSPDGRRLFTSGSLGLAAFDTAGLRASTPYTLPLWLLPEQRAGYLAAGNQRLAATSGGDGYPLRVYDDANGKVVAQANLPDYAQGLASGPNGGWAARVGGAAPHVLRYSADLQRVITASVPSGNGLAYDATRERYLLSGTSWNEARRAVVMALDAASLARGQEVDWSGQICLPDVFAPLGDRLLGICRYGNAHLATLDPATLQPAGRVPLGIQLKDMALDAPRGVLYVADNQDTVHLLRVPAGQEIAAWPGRAPLALVTQPAATSTVATETRATSQGRLYVNSPEGVQALDSQTGRVLARFPQPGQITVDPARDLVYLTDNGVSTYDGQGKPKGRLPGTFPIPHGMVPNPAAVAARVDPATGSVAVVLNNGVPGSNNGTYLRIYLSTTAPGVDVPGQVQYVQEVVPNPGGGFLVSYGAGFKGLEALQRLDGQGKEQGVLRGRYGALAADDQAGLSYVAAEGALGRVRAGDWSLVDLWRGPDHVNQLVFNPATGQLYARNSYAASLLALATGNLPPLDQALQQVAVLPAEPATQLLLPGTTERPLVLVSDMIYAPGSRTTWLRQAIGSLPINAYLSDAGRGALFYAGRGQNGADGVWRRGQITGTWQLISAGLADLRAAGPVLARSVNEAYFNTVSGDVYAWQPVGLRWARVLTATQTAPSTPSAGSGSRGSLALAPDGALFLSDYDHLWSSRDRGSTWQEVARPASGGQIIGFLPAGAGYTTYCYTTSPTPALFRSHDGGAHWEQARPGLPLDARMPPPQFAAGQDQTIYLYFPGYGDSRLFRSRDGGDRWQEAAPDLVRDTRAFALSGGGQLWFGQGQGGVRVLAPGNITWTAAAAPAPAAGKGSTAPPPAATAATPIPGPTRAAGSTTGRPTTAPCSRPLSGSELVTAQLMPGLGCPAGPIQTATMARQDFEHGLMLWRKDEPAIYVLPRAADVFGGAGWQAFADTWREGEPADDPALEPPASRVQPVRGFGKVWREQLGGPSTHRGPLAPGSGSGPSTGLGWGLGPERGLDGQIQAWDGGLTLTLEGQRFYLLNDGTWFGTSPG